MKSLHEGNARPAPSIRADARANRDRILAAARELFAERGLDVEMREIARRAGVGLGTLYRNIATRDDFIAALVEEILTEVESMMDRAAELEDPLAAIEALLNGAFDIVDRNGALIAALKHVPQAHEHHERLAPKAAAFWQRALDAGLIRPELSSQLLSDLVGGFFDLYLLLLERHGAAQARQACIGVLLQGIRR